jgi:hypothetical protein
MNIGRSDSFVPGKAGGLFSGGFHRLLRRIKFVVGIRVQADRPTRHSEQTTPHAAKNSGRSEKNRQFLEPG